MSERALNLRWKDSISFLRVSLLAVLLSTFTVVVVFNAQMEWCFKQSFLSCQALTWLQNTLLLQLSPQRRWTWPPSHLHLLLQNLRVQKPRSCPSPASVFSLPLLVSCWKFTDSSLSLYIKYPISVFVVVVVTTTSEFRSPEVAHRELQCSPCPY